MFLTSFLAIIGGGRSRGQEPRNEGSKRKSLVKHWLRGGSLGDVLSKPSRQMSHEVLADETAEMSHSSKRAQSDCQKEEDQEQGAHVIRNEKGETMAVDECGEPLGSVPLQVYVPKSSDEQEFLKCNSTPPGSVIRSDCFLDPTCFEGMVTVSPDDLEPELRARLEAIQQLSSLTGPEDENVLFSMKYLSLFLARSGDDIGAAAFSSYSASVLNSGNLNTS